MHSSSTDTRKSPTSRRSAQANAAPDRADDTLLTFPDEVCALTRMEEATLRYKRHRGEAEFLFKMGKRLYAWKSDCIAYIEAHRLADQQD
ncbi:helix-turn-helix transcriptional regulator [Nonomuraea sp. CA-143628]|uniref:helix-turn-helix transcriptional regulator n=1 Tax=Nonomuraea sp. CA-143628 TaxID=3239997 RepID=UPI003D92CC8D